MQYNTIQYNTKQYNTKQNKCKTNNLVQSKVENKNLPIYKCFFYKRCNTYWATIRCHLNLTVKKQFFTLLLKVVSAWQFIISSGIVFETLIPLYLNDCWAKLVLHFGMLRSLQFRVLRLCISQRFLKRLHRYHGALPLIIWKIIWTSLYSNMFLTDSQPSSLRPDVMYLCGQIS